MKLRISLLLMFVSAVVSAQDAASLGVIDVTGMPTGAIVVSYDILETEAANRLVVEIRDENGIALFYAFDYVEGRLHGRIAGSTALPVRFRAPGRAMPVERTIDGIPGTTRFWEVGGINSPLEHEQLVTAVPLAERRFADVSLSRSGELPPEDALLAITYLVMDPNQQVLSQCTLESNLIRTSERMTPVSTNWVLAQGRPYLLVGFVSDGGSDPWPMFYRLYSDTMELVYQTEILAHIDPNRFPQPIAVDLTGDGEAEIVTFPNLPGAAPVVVLRPGPGSPSGSRVLALNDCATRMNGADVTALQRELERRGFSVGSQGIDGWYGPDTRAAVVRFQRSVELAVTGVADEATWQALGFR